VEATASAGPGDADATEAAILAAHADFTGNAPRADDMTFLVAAAR
jgi:hypothetical protein